MQIVFKTKNTYAVFAEDFKLAEFPYPLIVKSMDIYKNKMILCFQYGQIVEIELESIKKIEDMMDEDASQLNQTSFVNQTPS